METNESSGSYFVESFVAEQDKALGEELANIDADIRSLL